MVYRVRKMNIRKQFDRLHVPSERLTAFALCCVCFLAGSFFALWSVKGLSLSEPLVETLTAYRQRFTSGEGTAFGTGQVIFEHLLFPVLAFLAGLSAAGVLLVPLLGFARGFLLTFVSAVFLRVFGTGCLAALMLLVGVGAVFTVPCFFLVSVDAFCAAVSGCRTLFQRGAGPVFGKAYFLRFLGCLFVAFAAVFVKSFLIQRFILKAFSF